MLIKSLGIYYFMLGVLGGVLGFSFSLVLSLELNTPFTSLSSYFYYICLTGHGVFMIFYLLTPMAFGFFNYFFLNMGFLSNYYWIFKLSFFSFLLIIFSLFFMILALFLGEGSIVGWTFYTPLSGKQYSPLFCVDFLLTGLNIYLMGSMMSSFTVVASMFTSSFNFESFLDLPVFIWSFLLTSLLILFSTPSLLCVLTMLFLDSNFNTFYFDSEFGGSSTLFQSLFWFYSHPAVYIVMLPMFGLMSQMLWVICGGFLYNKEGMVFSMFSLSLLSFLVWGHHMASVGWGVNMKNFFMITTLMMSLPTGVKVFSWMYSMMVYGKSFSLMLGFLSLFMMSFSLGGMTGVFLANYSVDILYHDSFFVVGHFHTVLSSASLFGVLSGIFLFFKSLMNSGSKKGVFFIWVYFFLSFFMSIFQFLYSLHLLGLMGAPSSVLNFSLNNYLVLHLGSFSFLGVWISLLLFMFLTLNLLNGKEK